MADEFRDRNATVPQNLLLGAVKKAAEASRELSAFGADLQRNLDLDLQRERVLDEQEHLREALADCCGASFILKNNSKSTEQV